MQNDKTKSIVGYIVPICAIIFLLQKENSSNVKFHCAQAIVNFVAFLILSFIFGFISGITGIRFLSYIPYLAYIAFFIIGIVKANSDENPEIPVVGGIAKSIFGKQIEG